MTFLERISSIDVALVCLTALALLCVVAAIGWYRSHHTLDEFDQPWIEPRPYARGRVTPQVSLGSRESRVDSRQCEQIRPALYDQDAAP